MKPKRPNVLFITSDRHRADCYRFEGRRIRTPNLDRMAANGTRISAAVTPNLVCQPARASMLTGKLPLTHGVVDFDPRLAEQGALDGQHFEGGSGAMVPMVKPGSSGHRHLNRTRAPLRHGIQNYQRPGIQPAG